VRSTERVLDLCAVHRFSTYAPLVVPTWIGVDGRRVEDALRCTHAGRTGLADSILLCRGARIAQSTCGTPPGSATLTTVNKSETSAPAPRRNTRAPVVYLVVAVIVVVGLLSLLLAALRGAGDTTPSVKAREREAEGRDQPALGSNGTNQPQRDAPNTRASGRPWEATPETSPEVPEHHLPAWEVNPPPPDLNRPPPPPPRDTRDPATYRPPKHNPGGVNGDRPPREVPGLE